MTGKCMNKQRNNPMTDAELKRAAKCAAFMGWNTRSRNVPYEHDIYVDASGLEVPVVLGGGLHVFDYNPADNTPEGREQANDLWKKLDKDGLLLFFFDNGRHVQIQDAQTLAKAKVHVEGSGSWWNAALAAAVAKLQESKQ